MVVDSGNNRLGNVPVTFAVQQGGGNFAGQTTYTVNTDSDGRAAATLTLGLQEGNANNVVTATFPANQSFPATFTASGRAPGSPANTTITGVVLDNSNVAIPGVTLRAILTNVLTSNANAVASAVTAQTDAQGQFSIKPAPVGFVKLMVDGGTATRTGVYPSLEYDLVTVAGQTATVGQPIFLLPLNPANQLCVTAATGGGTLTIPEAPGFSLTFGPGQVTFPGGAKEGCVSVTVVHGDKVPMSPGFGQQPRFIVTIQPTGALFNPPAPITLPNVDGLKPRQVTEMYSFDHDIGSFVAIGTGTVSDDGLVLRSNQGVGVLKAGWHCGGNPSTAGTVADCPSCNYCDGIRCVPDPLQTTCTSACIQGGVGVCQGGNCTGGTPVNCGTATFCSGAPTCDPVLGCQPGAPVNCGSGDVCTGIRYCDPSLGCQQGTPLDCGPATSCTSAPTCDSTAGGCQPGSPVADGTTCGSNSLCLAGTCSQGSCAGQTDGTSCLGGGSIPGVCLAGVCTGSGSQCSPICNGGSCSDGVCSPQQCQPPTNSLGRITPLDSNGTCAVPINFHLTAAGLTNGTILAIMSWTSSTGVSSDLSTCTVSEIVTFPHTDSSPLIYLWQNPPYSWASNNPTYNSVPGYQPNPGVTGAAGALSDTHFIPIGANGWARPPTPARPVTALQDYLYQCTGLNGGNPVHILGPIAITRSVNQNADGSFKYTITELGRTATVNPIR